MTSPTEWATALAALPRPLLLALDVDGTLAPIVEDPWKARVPDACLADLRAIGAHADVTLAFITGRDFAGITRVLGPMPGSWRAVEHGARVIAPTEDQPAPRSLSEDEQERLDTLAAFVAETPALLERKPAAVAAHVRKLPAEVGDPILSAVKARAIELGFEVRDGRSVVEAELHPGDKGEALGRILAAAPSTSVFFAGDDVTDGPAITAAAEHPQGIGLYVASAERPEAPAGVSGVIAGTAGMAALLAELRRLLAGVSA